jgi:hypothetical protein
MQKKEEKKRKKKNYSERECVCIFLWMFFYDKIIENKEEFNILICSL